MKTKQLQQKREALVQKREGLIGHFAEAARSGQPFGRVVDDIVVTNEFLMSLDEIAAENRSDSDRGPRYAVSSLFLHESFKKLTADENEQFFFITGTEVEGVMVLDQCAEFTHQKRTRMAVVADMPSTHNLLIKLEQFGHKFLGHFHSHPGNGADATRPSGTDESFQKRLEDAGHVAVMAIFSRDGFVRFARLDQNFEIEIYGEGVEAHAPGIYRLTNLS